MVRQSVVFVNENFTVPLLCFAFLVKAKEPPRRISQQWGSLIGYTCEWGRLQLDSVTYVAHINCLTRGPTIFEYIGQVAQVFGSLLLCTD